MSVEMTAPEMNAEGQQPPEEPPKQEAPQKAAKKRTWICGNDKCKAVIDWLPEPVRRLPPHLIRCKKCQMAKQAAEASADAPAKVREAPKRAAQQHRPAGATHRAQAPRELTLEAVELCAFRSGIAAPQVEALLTALRSHLTPSSDK